MGRVIRIDNNRAVSKRFDNKPDKKRKVGRPTLRWLEDTLKDIRAMNIQGCRPRPERDNIGVIP